MFNKQFFLKLTNVINELIASGSCDAVYIDGGFSISEKTRFNVGEIVLFECFPGYKIKGSGTSVCQDDGSLSEIPICVLDESGLSIFFSLISSSSRRWDYLKYTKI